MPNGEVASVLAHATAEVAEDSKALIAGWPAVVQAYSGDEQVVRVRDKELRTRLTRQSLSGNAIPRVALPRFTDHGELLRFLREENLPGYFPFTAGVFAFKREGEDPARPGNYRGPGTPDRGRGRRSQAR
jgi:isobutyryl-CoA mutase